MGNLAKNVDTSISSLSASKISLSGQLFGNSLKANSFSVIMLIFVPDNASTQISILKTYKEVSNFVTSDDLNERKN